MSNACFLEFFEIIQDRLAKAPLVIELGGFVFQIKGLRFVELIIEEIAMGEVAFDKDRVIRRQLQGFQRSGDRLARLAVEELIPTKVAIILSISRIQFDRLLYVLDGGIILFLFSMGIGTVILGLRFNGIVLRVGFEFVQPLLELGSAMLSHLQHLAVRAGNWIFQRSLLSVAAGKLSGFISPINPGTLLFL